MGNRAFIIPFFSIICLGTLFLSLDIFVDRELTSRWLLFEGMTLAGVIFFTLKNWGRLKYFRLDFLTISIFCFVAYIIVQTIFSSAFNNYQLLPYVSFLLLYLLLKATIRYNTFYLDVIIVITCLVQSLYAISQYMGIVKSDSTFITVGSFSTPVGIAACLSAGLPFCLNMLNKNKWFKGLGISTIITISASVAFANSRAGMIVVIVVILLFSYEKVIKNRLNRKTKALRYLIPLFILGIVIVFSAFLKKESSMGRLSIWNITGEMIKNNSIFGSGKGAFQANYMLYQANYFEKNPDNEFTILAGNVPHPLNEYLMLTTEFGIIGLTLFLIIIVYMIISGRRNISTPFLCVLAIGIFSCFSYPLKYPFVIILLAYSLAQLSNINQQGPRIRINSFYKISAIIFCLAGLCLWINNVKFEYNWNKIAKKMLYGEITFAQNNYEKLYSCWNSNPLFLYNYGSVLNMTGQYQRSLNILHECEKYLNNYEVQIQIANNYYSLSEWNQAEKHYKIAATMCPSKFIPLYKLVLVYDSSNQVDEADRIARIIIEKQVKVQSSAIKIIKAKMRERFEVKE